MPLSSFHINIFVVLDIIKSQCLKLVNIAGILKSICDYYLILLCEFLS